MNPPTVFGVFWANRIGLFLGITLATTALVGAVFCGLGRALERVGPGWQRSKVTGTDVVGRSNVATAVTPEMMRTADYNLA